MAFELSALEASNLYESLNQEWLLTDGTGSFAMGTASGIRTRRYHGDWVKVLGANLFRSVLLAGVEAYAEVGNQRYDLSSNQYIGVIYPDGYRRIKRVWIGNNVEWLYGVGGGVVSKELCLTPQGPIITYRNTTGSALKLTLLPLVCHKPSHQNFRYRPDYPSELDFEVDSTVVQHQGVSIHLHHEGAKRTPFAGWYYRFEHTKEKERGLDPLDDLYCPCELQFTLEHGECAVLSCSLDGNPPQKLAEKFPDDLFQAAAEKFVVRDGEKVGIAAGFPWFGEWGRDTMISLPGILLLGGKVEEAKSLLRAYVKQMDKGIIPNRLVENDDRPDYNTVDATLWFVNCIGETLQTEWDEKFALEMFEVIESIVSWHRKGTYFGIQVDPATALLDQGGEGHQLTWMDAKIGDEVITPRSGKPVEINALWINALRTAIWIGGKLSKDTIGLTALAEKAEENFYKFWNAEKGWYNDTIDPIDSKCRPNQVIAMSLRYSPCREEHAKQALKAVEEHLLTPKGLRTLAPFEEGYCGRFEGPLQNMDRAYHQGTVWPWLLGPYVEAVLKWTGDVERAKNALSDTDTMLKEFGVGGIAEVYDGDAPHRPNGCPWQAWSVAEIRRARKLVEERLPNQEEVR